MNTIAVTVEFIPSFSTSSRFRAIAIINGRTTNVGCGHQHKTRELALKCGTGTFLDSLEPLTRATLHGEDDPDARFWDAFWRDGETLRSRRLAVKTALRKGA